MPAEDLVPSDLQDASDRSQIASDSDQATSDRDQTAADADQAASERDQVAADRDQESADRDRASREPEGDEETYARSRRARSMTTLERDVATEARTRSAREREAGAGRRDAVSEWRDAAAALRGHSSASREGAAADREHAAEDRRQAAQHRRAAAEEIARHGVDHLTGALRRQAGLAAMERECDRSARAQERLVVAFIHVHDLEAVDDAQGDALLQQVAHCVNEHLRSYDIIARYAGDEFVCTVTGDDVDGVRRRFDAAAEHLSRSLPGAAISVAFAERELEEPLTHLIGRADAKLRSAKQAGRP